MSDNSTIRARRTADGGVEQVLPDGSTGPFEGQTDWTRFDAITDEEAYQNALDDPDNPPLTEERLAKMRRIPNPRRLRESLNMTQREFARTFEIGLQAIRDWEDGVYWPDSAAKTYLRLIDHDPEAIIRLLKTAAPKAPFNRTDS